MKKKKDRKMSTDGGRKSINNSHQMMQCLSSSWMEYMFSALCKYKIGRGSRK